MELAARFRVSQGTVRKAIDELFRDLRADGEIGAGVEDHVERALAVEHYGDEYPVVDPLES